MTLNRTSADILTETLAKNHFAAAPMAGVTTPPFRLALREWFGGLIYTEMVSVEGLIRAGKKTLAFIDLNEHDNPVGVQLFGSKAQSFHDAVKVCEAETNADFYDINMGCPVKKVLKSGSGSALLKDTANIQKILNAARKATDKPVTVKIRLGWDRGSVNYPEVIRIACGEGIDLITLHGRTKSEMFSGEADYKMIADAVKLSAVPVIGNGNVADTASYKKMLETGVAGVMIGRAMMKAPWIFKALAEGKEPDRYLTPEEIRRFIHRMIKYESLYRKEQYFKDSVKKYAVWFSKGLPEAAEFRTAAYATESLSDLVELIDNYFTKASSLTEQA